MIKNLSDLFQYLQADKRSKGVSSWVKGGLFDPVFRFTILLRLNEYLQNSNKPFIFRALPLLYFRRLSVRLGFSVPLNVFGAGLAIVHYGLLVVNPSAKIGKNCRIHAGVNIGGAAGFVSSEESRHLAPTIGHNCYIGPGVKMFGPIVIGDSCVIGANAVVNKSFENSDVTIGGIPAKIISYVGSNGKVKLGATLNL